MGTVVPTRQETGEVLVRNFDKTTDVEKVLALEQTCEAGDNANDMTLLQDLLGDPLSRVRHYPTYSMMVAEVDQEIVGVVRAGIKTVVCGKSGAKSVQSGSRSRSHPQDVPIYARAAYLLGLRVSPAHRRMGIGLKLAMKMEEWCKAQGVEYIYFATTKDNAPSLNLFTDRLQYTPFRYPALLGHPIWHHSVRLPSHIEITKLSVEAAVAMYRSVMNTEEFFPEDIDKIMNHKLCAGTWVATLREDRHSGLCCGGSCRVSENMGTIESSFARSNDGRPMPKSWAVLSLWKCNEIFSFQVKGVPLYKRTGALISRCLDKAFPWCNIPSFPNVFNPFGLQFLFGLHAEGPKGSELFRSLCRHAHNVSRKDGCQVLLTEVGATDPLRHSIPHWEKFSFADDVWCVKNLVKLANNGGDNDRSRKVGADLDRSYFDWCRVQCSTSTMFVDPRDV
ncbi:hypothetical protein Mapa_006844 [Marchantia paleacea]|nr:hypothetical protein Mapa_006844 [Marchantia paleacea]